MKLTPADMIPDLNYIERAYSAYKKRYFRERGIEVDENQWANLMEFSAQQLREDGCSNEEVALVLLAQSARDVINFRQRNK